DKRTFCTDNKYDLKFFVNHHQLQDISNYVIKQNDRVLISYGNENSTQIASQLARLDSFTLVP
ncbi:MAG: protein-disulfide isomerase, partial [Thaumarchaeota archaeon]|nr:protein-disulfide isomerase [Nitrososphaerota archaeon]